MSHLSFQWAKGSTLCLLVWDLSTKLIGLMSCAFEIGCFQPTLNVTKLQECPALTTFNLVAKGVNFIFDLVTFVIVHLQVR